MYPTILLVSFGLTWAQQLSDSQIYMGYPGLSSSCEQALNTSVSCPAFLSPVSVRGGTLDTDEVTALCSDTCYSSLGSARDTIKGACTASTDVIVYNDQAYPATFIVDNFIYTYSLSCRKDSKTGQFCDPQILAWSNQTQLTSAQSCSDCWLGVQAMELGSPLGYNDDLASNFASLTSSCSASGYAFTSPTAYALNSTVIDVPPSATATPPQTCTNSYIVQVTDNCNSIAKAHNVSTFNLLYDNSLDLYCKNFAAAVGTSLCIPLQCDTYTWQALDSCSSVVSRFTGMTIPQFLAWNPNFNSLCQNTLNFVGNEVCVGPPGGYIDSKTNSTVTQTTAATVAAPAPTNAMDGSNRNCGNWYAVVAGDTCGLVSVANYISLSDFLFLNPEINKNCSNLDLGVAYCVEPVGNLATYSGYTTPAGPTITISSATFSTVNTAIPTATSGGGYIATSSLLPKASGTIDGCKTYRNHDAINDLNECSYIEYAYGATNDQLVTWNPSLSRDVSTCNFQSGFSYCVSQSTGSTMVSTSDNCVEVNATEPGTVNTCDCFTTVFGYQNDTGYGCQDIADDNSITIAQLTTWNTWLASACDKALYANLAYQDTRAVCIGVNASEPTGTAASPPSKTPLQSGSNVSTSMGPTQTGVVAGCQKFYTVKSGDSCTSVEGMFAITSTQFYQWNPSVGSKCENMWLKYAYCVQGPTSDTTGGPTPTGSGPASPTQSGITSNCKQYYTVASGNSCTKIETQFSVTFDQLYQWNPAIDSNCGNLWVGYAVCVAVGT